MDEKCKECWNCFYYRAFYIKGLCRFDKLDNGICKKHGKQVDNHDTCAGWGAIVKLCQTQKDISVKKLNTVMESIEEIRQILHEAVEEEKGLGQ